MDGDASVEDPLRATGAPTSAEPPRRVLVTGGSGYIGRALVPALERRGAAVCNLDLRPGPGRWVGGDVRTVTAGLGASLPPADAVVHLAGLAGGWPASATMLHDVNAGGTRAIVEHAVATGARRVLVVSSIAVLGPSELPVDEFSPLRPTTPYGRSKARAERRGATAAAGADIELVVVRPGYVFGPGHTGNFGRMVAALRAGRFTIPGREDTLKAGIGLPDLVGLLVHLLHADRPPPVVHAVYPDTPTVLALARMVASHVGGQVRVLPAPAVRVALSVARAAGAASGSRRLDDLVDTAAKLQHSSNVVSAVLPLPGLEFRHGWPDGLAAALAGDLSGAAGG